MWLFFPYVPFTAVASNEGISTPPLSGKITYARVADTVPRYQDRGIGTGGLLYEGAAAGQDNVASQGNASFLAAPIRLSLRVTSTDRNTFVLVLYSGRSITRQCPVDPKLQVSDAKLGAYK